VSEQDPGAFAGNSTAASAGERDDSQRSEESAAEKATRETALAGNSTAASAGERDDSRRPEKKVVTSNTDPLSILALASAIAALVLTVFSLMPMLAFCFIPIGALCAATALISGLASVIRTTINPKLEGRPQALAALGMLLIYGGGIWVLLRILERHSG
jgi:VIT1/CCC1 family predicted Fe2+/Mn2+ transporter